MKKLLSLSVLSLLFIGGVNTALAGFSIFPGESSIRQFSFELDPGKSKASTVVIDNLSGDPLTIKLYGADGTQSNQGTFALTTLTTEQRHIGKWVKFAEETVTIEPRGRKTVTFTINVPADATPGVYSGGIAAEEGGQTNGDTKQSGAVSTSSRVVIKLFVSINGEKKTSINWTDFSYKNGENGNRGIFHLAYENSGNTIIMADQQIIISGLFGLWNETIDLATATLMQGKTVEIPVKWENEPFFGFYTAKATVTLSEYDIIKNSKINPQTQTKELNLYIPLKAETTGGKITIVALILFIIAAGSFITMAVKRRNFVKNAQSYTVQANDTLVNLAAKTGISWEKLAKLNKLKPPYNLQPGQKILIPKPKK